MWHQCCLWPLSLTLVFHKFKKPIWFIHVNCQMGIWFYHLGDNTLTCHGKPKFAIVKWYNLHICLQIIETQIVLLSFKLILLNRIFKTFSLCRNVALLRARHHRWLHGINAMILMPLYVIANKNVRNKCNELEFVFHLHRLWRTIDFMTLIWSGSV